MFEEELCRKQQITVNVYVIYLFTYWNNKTIESKVQLLYSDSTCHWTILFLTIVGHIEPKKYSNITSNAQTFFNT